MTLEGLSLVAGFADSGQTLVAIAANQICLWTPEIAKRKAITVAESTPLILEGKWGRPYAVNPAGSLAARGRNDGTIELWDLKRGIMQGSWKAHPQSVGAIAFSRDGVRLASGSNRGEVKLWNIDTCTELGTFGTIGRQTVSLAFDPTGVFLAASGEGTGVWLWNLQTGEERKLTGPIDVFAVAFSPDGGLLAATTTAANAAFLWRLPSCDEKITLKGHLGALSTATFSPDGKTLATGATDRRVILWNVATQQELVTLNIGSSIPTLDFSPDGRMLAFGDFSYGGRSIQVLDAPTFNEINALEKREGPWRNGE